MKSTVSISEGQNNFPALVKAAEKGRVITVTRHDEPVACVIAYDRMSAVAETLEIMGNMIRRMPSRPALALIMARV